MQSGYSTTHNRQGYRWESLAPLQRCSKGILQPTVDWAIVGRVLPLSRDTVGVFYNPQSTGQSLGESCPSPEIHSGYSTTHSRLGYRWESLVPLQRYSRGILQPTVDWAIVGRVLSLSRDTVGVFYNPQSTGLSLGESCPPSKDAVGVFYNPQSTGLSLGESYPSPEIQSGYSTTHSRLGYRWESLVPLQRYSRGILQPTVDWAIVGRVLPLSRDTVGVFYNPQSTGLSLGESCPSPEIHSGYSTTHSRLGYRWESLVPLQRCSRGILQPTVDWDIVGIVLPLSRDTVGVFYNPQSTGLSLG